MTISARKPAIALVDDDYHSARLMTRMLEGQGAPGVSLLDPASAMDDLAGMDDGDLLAVVDLKSSSTATADFLRRLKSRAPDLLVVAMSPSLDRDTRGDLLDAGASAVFERHADIDLYRREAAGIVDFWARNRRLDRTGT